jgi:hypothetical protein
LAILKDPIVLFLLLGAAFAAVVLANRSDESARPPSDLEILVTDADVVWLGLAFEKTRQRPATPTELRDLVENRVRDEMLYREAIALGLDQGDDGLRQRLGQKIAFLVKDAGAAVEPTEAELAAHLAANPAKYAVAPRRRFVHVYVNADMRGAEASAHATALLERLRTEPELDPKTVGDRLMIEAEQPLLPPALVARQFGDGFAKDLFALAPSDEWQGPLESGYGLHLVRIVEAAVGEAPPLDRVRKKVRADLVRDRREAAFEAYLETLREKYDVRIQASGLEGEALK